MNGARSEAAIPAAYVGAGPAGALMESMTLVDLQGEADAILVGRVGEIGSHWSADGHSIETDATLSVERILQGDPATAIVLTLPGGRVGELQVLVGGMPSFRAGERSLLFLRAAADGSYGIAGGYQGKFGISSDGTIDGLGVSVDDFASQLADGLTDKPVPLTDNATLTTAAVTSSSVRWHKDTVVPYYINPDANRPESLTTESVTGELNTAFATWDNLTTAAIDVSYAGTTSRDGTDHADGYNDIVWGLPSDFPSAKTLGLTYLAWNTDGFLINADVRLNPAHEWFTDGLNDTDLQTVALHEIGHFFGLGHSTNMEAIMYPSYEGIRRDLGDEDKEIFAELYPVGSEPTPTPSGNEIELVVGWNLVAYQGAGCAPPRQLMQPLIEGGSLNVAWEFLADSQSWLGFDPAVPDELNVLAEVCGDDIIWLYMGSAATWLAGP